MTGFDQSRHRLSPHLLLAQLSSPDLFGTRYPFPLAAVEQSKEIRRLADAPMFHPSDSHGGIGSG
jgi:hypothetical protein